MHGRVAAVALLLAVTGCTAPAAVPEESTKYETLMSAEPKAVELVGLWSVTGAPGQTSKQWLRMSARTLAVFEPCGGYVGGWRAHEGRFVADISGAVGGSCGLDDPSEHWLYSVTTYVRWGEGSVSLTDEHGDVVASLAESTEPPPPSSEYAKRMTDTPVVTDAVRAVFSTPVALPANVAPVVPQGRWTPVLRNGYSDTYLNFERGHEPGSNGSWTGSDGCNTSTGRWFVENGGLFAATIGPTTGVACAGSNAPSWTADARRVGMLGDELTFYDAKGKKLGSLTKEAGSD